MLAAALVVLAQGHLAPAAAQEDEGSRVAEQPVFAPPPAPVSSAEGGLGQQVDALRLEVSELRAALHGAVAGNAAPRWAEQMQARLDERLERMAQMQERLAARIETPTPRLDEPIVLFTVAGCMLLFGFMVGRGVQRRSNRRDLRLRL